jgi:hypothetical protein
VFGLVHAAYVMIKDIEVSAVPATRRYYTMQKEQEENVIEENEKDTFGKKGEKVSNKGKEDSNIGKKKRKEETVVAQGLPHFACGRVFVCTVNVCVV